MPAILPTTDPTDFGNKPGDGPLRVGGRSADSLPATGGNRPDKRSKASASQQPAVRLCRDEYDGNEVMKARGMEYLPKAGGESTSDYNVRLNRSVFFNYFRQTVTGLVGLIFRKDPVLGDDVDRRIVDHYENIDLAGTHGDVFLRELEADAIQAGHAAILVEYPVTQEGLTVADEIPLRPYWVPVRKEDIMSWRTGNIDGVTSLLQIVIRQSGWVADGLYGEAMRHQYLVIQRNVATGVVAWQKLEVSNDGVVAMVDDGTYRNQTEIPLSEVSTNGKKSMFESTPPLIDVAFLNLAHYQMWSDYSTSIHKTCVPVFVLSGVDPRDRDGNPIEVIVGPNTVVTLENPQARAEYVSHDGAALASVEKAMENLKSDIGTLGLSMLSPQKRMAETAEAKRLDKSTSDSALAANARALQDAAERALGFHAKYMGVETGGSIVINRDFEGLLMDSPVMLAYSQLVQVGFPGRLVLKALQDGGRIPEDEDLDMLELEFETNRLAERERKALAAQSFDMNQAEDVEQADDA